jgi:hypothetical protein
MSGRLLCGLLAPAAAVVLDVSRASGRNDRDVRLVLGVPQ